MNGEAEAADLRDRASAGQPVDQSERNTRTRDSVAYFSKVTSRTATARLARGVGVAQFLGGGATRKLGVLRTILCCARIAKLSG